MDRRSFIKNILLSGVGFLAVSKYLRIRNKSGENSFKELPYILNLEIHLVEHCNLKCKYCSHFSSIAEKKFYDVQKYEKDLARLAYVTKGQVRNLLLLGGEPLLHPELVKLINITRFYFPNSNIDIITNGTLLNTMNDAFWIACHKNDVYIVPSLYPIKIDWKPIFDKAKKYKVNIATDGRKENLNIDNVQSHIITQFYKLKIDSKGKENYVKRFNDCHYPCTNFIDGKLYPCFVISNIKHFNKRFKKNIPVTAKDYIDIYKTENMQEVVDLVFNPVPFCKYCRHFERPKLWQIGNQNISEWT